MARCERPAGQLRRGRSREALGAAEREGDVPPRVEVRGGGRQVEDDAAHRGDDVGPQFEQPVPQPGHLGASTGGPRRAQPEFLHQHIGRGGEEDAQLIRPEATAAGPTDLEPVVQLFDPGEIAGSIRSTPETPRQCTTEEKTLVEIRTTIEKHIKNSYLKRVDAPVGVKPLLKCWMELNEG